MLRKQQIALSLELEGALRTTQREAVSLREEVSLTNNVLTLTPIIYLLIQIMLQQQFFLFVCVVHLVAGAQLVDGQDLGSTQGLAEEIHGPHLTTEHAVGIRRLRGAQETLIKGLHREGGHRTQGLGLVFHVMGRFSRKDNICSVRMFC